MGSKNKNQVHEQPLTYEDYAALPEDGNRYELADGVLEAMTPAPSPRHQLVIHNLQFNMAQTCQSEYIIMASPIDVILSSTEVRQPDIVMIHRNRLSIVSKRGIEGAPDLVVEILSPSSIKRDRKDKQITYARFGIPEFWLVDNENEVLEQYVLTKEHYQLKDVYQKAEPVNSEQVSCVSFSMKDIMRGVRDLP